MKSFLIPALALVASTATAFAEDAVTIKITGNDQMLYDKTEFTVKSGQKVTIEFEHVGKLPKIAMGHNVCVLKPGTALPAFAMKCAPAAASDYIPQDPESKKVIVAHTAMVGGGETTSTTFTAGEPGTYPYLCTFPGHFAQMSGKMIVEAAE